MASYNFNRQNFQYWSDQLLGFQSPALWWPQGCCKQGLEMNGWCMNAAAALARFEVTLATFADGVCSLMCLFACRLACGWARSAQALFASLPMLPLLVLL